MSRALILSCSRSKRPGNALLPAIERYDGPAFRVLRRYIRESNSSLPAVQIISAEFGLISTDKHVGYYDRLMTPSRVKELQPFIADAFATFVQSHQINDLMIVASNLYVQAMAECWLILDKQVVVRMPSGSIGGRVSQLYDWLYGAPPARAPVALTGHVKFKGREITASADEVLQIARRELPKDAARASKFESWCVPVGKHVVAPKWLVSKLTDISVSEFRTADALFVLQKLGVEVRRVSSKTPELHVAKGLT